MQDFLRDWRRWTRAERVLASVICLSMVMLLSLNGCADPDSVSGSGFERGIDQDVSATHDAGATSLRDLSLRH